MPRVMTGCEGCAGAGRMSVYWDSDPRSLQLELGEWGEWTGGNGKLGVTTGCRVRSGRLTRTSKGVDEHLCSESGARLNSQAGDKMY